MTSLVQFIHHHPIQANLILAAFVAAVIGVWFPTEIVP